MEYLQTLLDNSEIPIITAFLLGLLHTEPYSLHNLFPIL